MLLPLDHNLCFILGRRSGTGLGATGELGTAEELSGGAGVGGLSEKGHYCIADIAVLCQLVVVMPE